MQKVGILTLHYSTNYGGVLQGYALYRFLKDKNYNVELVDYVPSTYSGGKIYRNIGLKSDRNPMRIINRVILKYNHCKDSISAFDLFRQSFMDLSEQVDEHTLGSIVSGYNTLIVGSDQIWTPSLRGRPEYFLGYDNFTGSKVSYAADSTIATVSDKHMGKLKKELGDFDRISVRNTHSQQFVKTITGQDVPIVADPSLCGASKS